MAEWTAISADSQRMGRGQRTKTWQDVPGKALLCTLVSPKLNWPGDSLMTRHMAVAVALCEAIESQGIGPILLKWPNDLYFEGRKVGGLLTEAQWVGVDCTRYAGSIGLNVQQAPPGFASLASPEEPTTWRERLLPIWIRALTFPNAAITESFTARLVHRGAGMWRIPNHEAPQACQCVGVDTQGRIGLRLDGEYDAIKIRWYVHGQAQWVGAVQV